MPKQCYGKANSTKSRVKPSGDSQTSVPWLTLASTLGEERLHAAVSAAFRQARPQLEDEVDGLAAVLIEYNDQRRADCAEAWVSQLCECFSDAGIPLGEDEVSEEGDAEAAERAGAETLVAAMRHHKALRAEPPPPRPLSAGDAVLAVLDEDGDWHEARVESVAGASGGASEVVSVRFVEWRKLQETPRAAVVALDEVADDEGGGEVDQQGGCELCGRQLRLTFHHLVPKETHGRYIGKGLPPGVAGAAAAKGMAPEPSRTFLCHFGAVLCRFCHATVHRFAPNDVLAEQFNTLEKLQAQPAIERFVAYASRQRATQQRAL